MSVQVVSEVEILREATQVLLQHLTPSKVARFWASWQRGRETTWRGAMRPLTMNLSIVYMKKLQRFNNKR